MTPRSFLRGQLDRPALEYGSLLVAACGAVFIGYFAFVGGLYAGLPAEDLAREQGLLLTLIDPALVLVALPVGLLLVPLALGTSLLLPRHALLRAWLLTSGVVLIALSVFAAAMGALGILHVTWVAPAVAALTWVAFPPRTGAP